MFSICILKMFFDLFPKYIYRFKKNSFCEIHLPRVLNHCKFLVISGSNIEISKQSKYRNYYGYCYFLERKKFRSKLGARNHKECMSDCFFFEGGVMSYTDYHRSWLQFSWNCKKKNPSQYLPALNPGKNTIASI